MKNLLVVVICFFYRTPHYKENEIKYDSGIVVYDTDIDFVWRIKRRDLGMQRNENLYKIWKAEYDN